MHHGNPKTHTHQLTGDVFVLDDSVLNFLAGLWGGACPVTKPLAGYGRARIVGTIGGTAHRPPIMSAPRGVAHYQEIPHE